MIRIAAIILLAIALSACATTGKAHKWETNNSSLCSNYCL